MKSLPSSQNARPLLSFALFVSVIRNSLISKCRGKRAVAHSENRKERRHDRGGTRDDDSAHNAHFAIGVAFRHPIRAAPDLDHAPQKPEEEHPPQAGL